MRAVFVLSGALFGDIATGAIGWATWPSAPYTATIPICIGGALVGAAFGALVEWASS